MGANELLSGLSAHLSNLISIFFADLGKEDLPLSIDVRPITSSATFGKTGPGTGLPDFLVKCSREFIFVQMEPQEKFDLLKMSVRKIARFVQLVVVAV